MRFCAEMENGSESGAFILDGQKSCHLSLPAPVDFLNVSQASVILCATNENYTVLLSAVALVSYTFVLSPREKPLLASSAGSK